MSRGVPAETGLPCDKAAVFEESVNETPSITYTIKGKTRKGKKLRFYITMTVMILHNGKEWAQIFNLRELNSEDQKRYPH